MVKPSFETCQCCPDWDDINGCWKDCKHACVDDDGEFKGLKVEDEDEEDANNPDF